jgi:hypothetical protein
MPPAPAWKTLVASLMTDQIEINKLKVDLNSSDKDVASKAADRLAKIGGHDIVDYFISLLDNESLRNLASIALHDIADNRALEPLLKAINKPENRRYNGTMVYALQNLDCSEKLVDLFDLLFYHDYEVKMGVVPILTEQPFNFTDNDLEIINQKWVDLQKNPQKCVDFEKMKNDLAYYVDGFLNYKDNKTSH